MAATGAEFVLLPGEGVLLPSGGGLLGFGATRESALRRLAWFGSVSSTFVCGAEWCWSVRIADRVVTAWAGADSLLGEIGVGRCAVYAWGEPAGIPAVYQGIDVFAVPLSELVRALTVPDDASISFHQPWEPAPDYVTHVTLSDESRRQLR